MSQQNFLRIPLILIFFAWQIHAGPAVDPQEQRSSLPAPANDNQPDDDDDEDEKQAAASSVSRQERRQQCRAAYRAAVRSCSKNIEAPSRKKGRDADKDPAGTVDATGRMDNLLDSTDRQVARVSSACTQAAQSCLSTCQGSSRRTSKKCHSLHEGVAQQHSKVRREIEHARRETKKIAKSIGSNESPGDGASNPILPSSLPAATPDSTAKQQEKPPQKTEEQLKQERREQRLNAMNKTFEQMGGQNPMAPALQEQSLAGGMGSPYGAAQAMAAGGAAAPVNESEAQARPVRGEAGWTESSDDPKVQGRKKAGYAPAAATGGSRSNPAQSAFAASGSSAGSDGHFGQLQGGAELTPQTVARERPSDLPHLKIETPSAAGGSGGNYGSGSRAGSGLSLADYLPNGSRYKNRGPAGLDQPDQIRTPSVDIWQIISIRFRSRCAEGRLMDCAPHMPK